MKTFVAIAALVAAANAGPAVEGVSSSLVHAALRAKWSSYKAQHGKDYAAHVDSAKMSVFLQNTQVIEEHNTRFHQGLESFEMGHNHLSDHTLDEIMTTRMGVKMPADAHEIAANATVHEPALGYTPPDSLDWTKWNAVQEVKNQGSCGSCYTFSAVGSLETVHWRKYNNLPNLSEQQLVDCTREYGNGGCSGGWMHTAFKWLQDKQVGYVNQGEYPYTAAVGNCQSKPNHVGKVAGYVRIGAGKEDDLLNALATVGTISIAYNAGTTQHAYYRSGVLDVPNCGNKPTHAVLLVGYGEENGVKFWRIKNSWGPGWGEKGYFRMARGKNMCGIADWASYPQVK